MAETNAMDNVSFAGVYDLVNESWPITQEAYHQVIGENLDDDINFRTRHILLHLSKIAADIVKVNGEIARVVEDTEHTGNFLGNKLRQTPKQLIINAMKLAETLGVTPEEIIRGLMDWAVKQYELQTNTTSSAHDEQLQTTNKSE